MGAGGGWRRGGGLSAGQQEGPLGRRNSSIPRLWRDLLKPELRPEWKNPTPR